MQIHFSLARARQARLQKYFRAISRAPQRGLDDSSTMMQVLAQIQICLTANVNDRWFIQFSNTWLRNELLNTLFIPR